MKNNKLRGCMDVFRFTYVQSMKSKAMKITIAIFCVLALLSFPVISLITGEDSDKEETTTIQKAYVYEDNIEIFDYLKTYFDKDSYYSSVELAKVDKATSNDIKENKLSLEDNKDIVIDISYCSDETLKDYGLHFMVYYNDLGELTTKEIDELTSFIYDNAKGFLYNSVGVDIETADLLTKYVTYSIFDLNTDGEIVTDGISDAQYGINYALLMVVLMCISFSGAKVAEQIVTEKSTKVVEYILVSVKPMAIVTGKVMASVAVVFSWLASVVASIVVSGFINGAIFAGSKGKFVLPEIITNFFDSSVVTGANIFTVIISLLILIEGFVFYGFLGGISGAMVSKIEELAEGNKLFTFAMLIGAYLALALIMSSSMGDSGWGALNNIVYFLPLSAVFIVPSYMLFGIITPLSGILIVFVNLIFIALLLIFVSRIYEQMIYNSGKLKIKDLFQLSKNQRRNK